ncbi:MAG: bifunctional 4-hydroxy-2-oxoglutarate aldolase/2-dehydro-3-deoxy-phosphogluconate aldolase [Eudoraea sp.]|nr:bifunctional 4-hydroxy-2-oxoglutarate aldolase/2-dehydro-3-deoxy-phosphogluconate aldolase [Eudoraea sp.]
MDANSQNSVVKDMQSTGLVPVFNHSDIEVARRVLDACYEGGVRVFEFTNRSSNAPAIFEQLIKHAEQFEDLRLGIGTIFTAQKTREFQELGAEFIVSPAMIPEMGDYCYENNVLWIPGCGSVTEIFNAKQLGAKLVKIFPGNVLGAGFVKSVKAVFPEMAIMPTGGVAPTEENFRSWFDAGVICVGMGSKLISKEILAKKDFAGLETKVRNTLDTIRNIRS